MRSLLRPCLVLIGNPLAIASVAFFLLARDVNASTVLPVPDETRARVVPKGDSLQSEITYKKLYDEERQKQLEADDSVTKRLRDIRAGMKDQAGAVPPANASAKAASTAYSTQAKPRARSSVAFRQMQNAVPRVSYIVTDAGSQNKTVIPLGSVVRALPLTGLEATALEPSPLLLSLEAAFLGPNKKRVDLSQCFMLAKAKAALSVERVIGETTEISCVRDNGEHIRRSAQGFLAGSDGTFGIQGKLISNQRQVFLTSVLASLAKGAGEAVALAQKTTTVVQSSAGAQVATNVTGSHALLAAGQATTDAASMIAEWYLTFAKQLLPAIAIGASQEPVWITLLETVEIPPLHTDDEE